MRTCKSFCTIWLIAVLATCILPRPASASGFISARIRCEVNTTEPEMAAFRYIMTLEWDTQCRYSLSHANLSMGESPWCRCEEFTHSIAWMNQIGWTRNTDNGLLSRYSGYFECKGDPSIDLAEPLFKLEPDLPSEDEPGFSGVGEFVFYSKHSPWPISQPNDFMSMKFGLEIAYGQVTGVFPALPCGPVGTESCNWGTIKKMYR